MVVIDQYIIGGFIASLLLLYWGILGFVFSNNLRRNITKKNKSSKVVRKEECYTSTNGRCRPEVDGSTDIIIVGAGVAGAALAYTLGKVILRFILFF